MKMAKVIMTCGRLCSGKSTYAQKLAGEMNAVILSIDELMITLFGHDAGDKHDYYAERVKKYLYGKSAELIGSGTNVVLDWGFWQKADRDIARDFYGARDIPYEFHYINVSDEVWRQRIEKRNAEILAGMSDAYFVDDGLAEKFASMFDKPDKSEIDVWVE